MTNHVVLYEPLMPANTGNIARTCAGTNTVLDLIEPLGFQIDNKKMKRAGLDYWDKVDIRMHDDLNAFLSTLGPNDEMYLISKFSLKIMLKLIILILIRIIILYLERKQPVYQRLL